MPVFLLDSFQDGIPEYDVRMAIMKLVRYLGWWFSGETTNINRYDVYELM